MAERKIRVGQIWEDMDPRRRSRKLKIIKVSRSTATCEGLSDKKQMEVGLHRFNGHANGYSYLRG